MRERICAAAQQLVHIAGHLGPDERKALRVLCETADLFIIENRAWLLAPVTPELVDTLATFEAEAEDRESDLCDEAQADDEPSLGDPNGRELEGDDSDKEIDDPAEDDDPLEPVYRY